MSAPPERVVLTADMTYSAALALIAEARPRLPVLIHAPTIGHDKKGRPTADDLELPPGDRTGGVPGREAVLRGGMAGRGLHHAVITAFGMGRIFETSASGRSGESLRTPPIDSRDSSGEPETSSGGVPADARASSRPSSHTPGRFGAGASRRNSGNQLTDERGGTGNPAAVPTSPTMPPATHSSGSAEQP